MANLEPQRWDTEDNFNATLSFPNGMAAVHLTWTAGVRKVLYTVQGTQGAITVDDDDLQIARARRTKGPDVAQGAVEWEVERKPISSHWMDASHTSWFSSVFDGFLAAVRDGTWVGREARDAYRCVELITAAYRSARLGSREVDLGCSWPAGIRS
jgi:predicted dehydrogenase